MKDDQKTKVLKIGAIELEIIPCKDAIVLDDEIDDAIRIGDMDKIFFSLRAYFQHKNRCKTCESVVIK